MSNLRDLLATEERSFAPPLPCLCFPSGEAPGYCPGRSNCPLCKADEPEDEAT